MTEKEFRKQGVNARKFYEKEKSRISKPYMYYSLWRELMGLLETDLFKHPKQGYLNIQNDR